MNLEHYQYQTSADFTSYFFFSEGPKGKIRKVVTFAEMPFFPSTTYAIGFGDIDPESGIVLDNVITNNGDTVIVLTTVANIVIAFSKRYGNNYIFAEGSTPSRTRLYRICISKYLAVISRDFDVWGYRNSQFVVFQQNVDYQGFLVKRKI
jgi:hypothetical protein